MKVLILLIILISQQGLSQQSCEGIFFKLSKGKILKEYSSELMHAVAIRMKPDGREIIVYKARRDSSWDPDKYRVDPHGDPRNNVILLGEKAGKFWEFVEAKMNSNESFYTHPTIETLNRLVSIYNKKVPSNERIDLKFVEVESGLLTGLQFINLSADGIVAISKHGHIRIHDINYHVISNLIIPSSFHKAARNKTALLRDFYKYLEDKNFLIGVVREFMDHVVEGRAREIDLLTDFTVNLADTVIANREVMTAYSGGPQLANYVHSSLSPNQYMIATLRYTHRINFAKVEVAEIFRLYDEFIKQNPNANYSEVPTLPHSQLELSQMVFENYQRFIRNTHRIIDSP